MDVQVRELHGNWDLGFALDKHTRSSIYLGEDAWGHAMFETKRSPAGEALYQLKYRQDWSQAQPIAMQIAESIYPRFPDVGCIVTMPASRHRARQPVLEVATALGRIVCRPVHYRTLSKARTGQGLKDMGTKASRVAVLAGQIRLHDEMPGSTRRNVLLIDDRYDTGASLEEACRVLRGYAKVAGIYVVTITW
ncbi:putative amidophosphoribosyltransferase [Cupriavidus phytorum]|uniref:Amidophosphoribosyltransferase n=2 Tax=Cupriavidus TaxID=106589 RepID=A0A975XCL7_9BURK|nr:MULTISPECIES: ComF family protein [Cupriavidus]PZX24684.1 putative amidophosphoribosyltransferase [Cupriavidus alkaliphilus]SOY65949.1 putative amidophosphoribosyltransferase [Cupriavidus taiwanensis]